MNQSKSPFASRTLWGIALTAAGPYLPALLDTVGVHNGAQVVSAVVTIAGAATAVYGRFKATKPLTRG